MSNLSELEKKAIRDFAGGAVGSFALAVRIHRASINLYGLQRGDPYFDFMSECDTPCPDLLLRAGYRKAVLDDAK